MPEDPFATAVRALEAGRLAEAEALSRQALVGRPRHAYAWHLLGIAQGQQGNKAGAIESITRAIELNPNVADFHSNLGLAYLENQQPEKALPACERAVAIDPNHVDGLHHLGNALQKLGRVEESLGPYERAIALRPSFAMALSNFAEAQRKLGRLAESLELYEKAVALAPGKPDSWNNVGFVLSAMGRLDEAIAAQEKALALRPDYTAAHVNLGNALMLKLDVAGALRSFNDALFHQPDQIDAHLSRAMAELLLGDFEHGWVNYEWRWRKFTQFHRTFEQPLWNGFDVRGKTILLHAEQGFGDMIQFVRFARVLAERGATVIVECLRDLERLFQSVEGASRVISRGQPLPPFDIYSPLLSLPRGLGLAVDTIPAQVPYLWPEKDLCEQWRQRLSAYSDSYKIGIVWAGVGHHLRDADRSMAPSQFAPLAKLDNVRLFSLQKGGKPGAELGGAMVDFTADLHDFADTAALISGLDLVISVDTSVAHLAGALGKPVWTLLPLCPDWRWLLNRDDSPWYPTMRLFRQAGRGDWTGTMGRVVDALAQRRPSVGSADQR